MSTTDDIYKKLCFGVKRRKKTSTVDEKRTSPIINQIDTSNISKPPAVTAVIDEDEEQRQILTAPKLISGLNLSANKVGRRKLQKKTNKTMATVESETIRAIRKEYKIFTWGSCIVDPCIEFDQLQLPSQLVDNLVEFNMQKPTPVQMQTIPLMLQRRELLVSAPTGSGKTLAFVVPIIVDIIKRKDKSSTSSILAVILEPTHELAKQTYVQFLKFIQKLPITCTLMGRDESDTIVKCDILVTTPNRVVFALKNGHLSFGRVRWLIVDESDRLFETTEGSDRSFRDQLAYIYRACTSKYVHHAFFSATFSYEVEEWCKTNLDNLAVVCIGPRNTAVDSVDQELIFAGTEQGKLIALRQLFRTGFNPPVLIFVQSKERARQLTKELSQMSIAVDSMHSGRSQLGRDRAMRRFRSGKCWVLICTEVLGRGIDITNVNLVINFDMPTSAISYIHRIGRTGRAGRNGRAITYFTEQDIPLIRPIAQLMQQAGCNVPEYTLKMKNPSRNVKKELLRSAPKRKDLSTTLQNRLKKRPKVDATIK